MSTIRYGHRHGTLPEPREPYQRPQPYIGLLRLDLPGYSLDWTLRQDLRDMRRFRAVDLDGIQRDHCAPAEMLRRLALVVPHYSAPRC